MRAISAFFVCSVVLACVSGELLPYSTEEYNNLLDYRDARAHALDQFTIDSLGEIFLSHRVNNTFGLCLLHNHFHVLPGEIMVEVVQNDTSNTHPRALDWRFEGSHADILPAMLALTLSGDVRPLEFLDLKASNFNAYASEVDQHVRLFYDNSAAFTPFFLDLAHALQAQQLLSIFGVCVRHRDSITSADPTWSSLETNHPAQRWLRLDPMLAHAHKKDIIDAKWRRGEATATFWTFPLRHKCVGSEAAMCAECGCHGGMCAECGCYVF